MNDVATKLDARTQRRADVYVKCGGFCGYCGVSIGMSTMQIDHVHPRIAGGSDDIDNLMPSCRQCNNYKLFFTLEQFRAMVANQIELLRRNSTNFRTAERYGLVEAKPRQIVFYFERLGVGKSEVRE